MRYLKIFLSFIWYLLNIVFIAFGLFLLICTFHWVWGMCIIFSILYPVKWKIIWNDITKKSKKDGEK